MYKLIFLLIINYSFLPAIFLEGLITNCYSQFTQQGSKLVGTDASGYSNQGNSVSISADGNTAVWGGPYDKSGTGTFWVFTQSGSYWNQQGTKLVGTGAIGLAQQGFSVAVSADGTTLVEGGNTDNTMVGAIWVFIQSEGVWTQQGTKLVGSDVVGRAYFGYAVAISADGNTIAVGGYQDNNNIGAVWVFTRSSSVWTQQGAKLVGTGANGNAYQGVSVGISADGNTIVEGGFEDSNLKGAVWVFTRSNGVWTQQGSKLVGKSAVGSAYQGWSAAISGDGTTIAEGGYFDHNEQGAVWVFTLLATPRGGEWTQQGDKLVVPNVAGAQGYSVAISGDGNTILDGADWDNSHAGAVWVFTRSGGIWTQKPKLVGNDPEGNAWQGRSVSISTDGKTAIESGYIDDRGVGAIWVFKMQ